MGNTDTDDTDDFCKPFAYRAHAVRVKVLYLSVFICICIKDKAKREGYEVYSSKAAKRKLEAHEEEARPDRH